MILVYVVLAIAQVIEVVTFAAMACSLGAVIVYRLRGGKFNLAA